MSFWQDILNKVNSEQNKSSSKKKKKTQAKPGASEFPLASQYLSKRKSGEGATGSTGGATGGSTPTWQPPSTGTSGGSAPTGGIDDIL